MSGRSNDLPLLCKFCMTTWHNERSLRQHVIRRHNKTFDKDLKHKFNENGIRVSESDPVSVKRVKKKQDEQLDFEELDEESFLEVEKAEEKEDEENA